MGDEMAHHPLCMTLRSGLAEHCECPDANTCRACPDSCKECTWDNADCECYTHGDCGVRLDRHGSECGYGLPPAVAEVLRRARDWRELYDSVPAKASCWAAERALIAAVDAAWPDGDRGRTGCQRSAAGGGRD